MDLVGKTFDRWTVLKHLPPAKRRDCDNGARARVLVRCACGVEKPMWVQDLQRAVTGCNSKDCMAGVRAVKEAGDFIDERSRGASREVRQFARQLKIALQDLPRLTREAHERAAQELIQAQLRGETIDENGRFTASGSWWQSRSAARAMRRVSRGAALNIRGD